LRTVQFKALALSRSCPNGFSMTTLVHGRLPRSLTRGATPLRDRCVMQSA